MTDHLDQIDPQRKRDDYLREHLEDAHERAGDVVSHLAGARPLCPPDMEGAALRIGVMAERARELDRDLGRLLDQLFPREEPEGTDDDESD